MSITKTTNGTYQIDISAGYSPVTGKQKRIKRKGFKTKKEALQAEQEIRLVEFHENRYGTTITLHSLYQLLKKEDMLNNRKVSYINTQDNNYNRHIRPYFNEVDVTKLTYADIYEFRESLKQKSHKREKDKGLSNNTINKILILLKKIIDVGIRKGYYKDNPVKLLRKLPTTKKEISYWTIQEFQQFKSLFTPEEYPIQLFFTILYLTGIRLGEGLALTWADVDFQKATLRINKTAHRRNGQNVIDTPKTSSSNRIVSINRKLLEELIEWQNKQKELLSDFTKDFNNLQIIQSQPIEIGKNTIEKVYKQIIKRDSSLKPIRIHDFRHSHASLLINQGEDYLIVKERLGHSSITTTIDTYSHLYPSKQKELADKLDCLY